LSGIVSGGPKKNAPASFGHTDTEDVSGEPRVLPRQW